MLNQSPAGPASGLAKAVAECRRTFAGLGGFSLFINLLMLTGPLYMLQVYDRVLASGSVPTLVALTGLILGLYLTLGILDWIRQSLFSIVGARIEDRLADPALSAALAANLKDSGRSTDRPLQDLKTLKRFVAGPALPAMFDAPFAPIFFLALFMLHWAFGLWALFGAAVLLVLALANKATNSRLIKDVEEAERAAQKRSVEMTRNVEVIEALGMRRPLENRWRSVFDKASDSGMVSGGKLGAFTAGTKAFRLFLQSAILGLGAWLAIQGHASPGSMIAASILMGRAIQPIEQLVGQWRGIVGARDAWDSLKEALSQTPAAAEPMPLPAIQGRIDLKEVTASPPSSGKTVLRSIDLHLDAGEILGVIGASASGKSSLAKVLAGIWQPEGGTVRIDGSELNTWPRETLGPQIGYLPQQVDLFSGTVRENIARFRDDATPEAVIAAAQAAGCHDLILHLPNGYDTEIGESGAYLSAGQRQRIGLARALFGDPMLVILDEPNSNLDSAGDEALQNALIGLKTRKASVVIIAHRPNAITQCTKLLVLDNGEVSCFGARDEVLQILSEAKKSTRVTPLRPGAANV